MRTSLRKSGPLFSLLLQQRVVADTGATFARFAGTDWRTLHAAIPYTSDFLAKVSPDTLPEEMLADMFASEVSNDVKQTVLRRIDEFAPNQSIAALSGAALFALTSDTAPSPDALAGFAAASVDAQLVIQLLALEGPGMTELELGAILNALPTPYNQLTSRTGKVTVINDEAHINR